jgi:hypothetical protein
MEEMIMSNYIVHSSGEWKNHKWIRREGGPGNYKYYYKNTSSKNPSSSPRGEKSHGSGVADTEHDKAFDLSRSNTYPITGAGKYYEAEKFDKDRKKKVNAETKRRAMGEAYRNEMVNRMIDAMSGKTVTAMVNANRAKAKAKKEYINNDMRSREAQAKHTNAVGGERRKTKQQQWYEKNKAIKEDMRYRSIRFNNGKTHKVGSVS